MKRLLKVKVQKKNLRAAHEIEPTERMYEMENAEKIAEAVYEVIDHDKKEVTFKNNPAYAIHK